MKRGYFAAALLLLILFLGGGLLWASMNSLSLSAGICLKTQNGDCLLIVDQSPVVLSQRGKTDIDFSDFSTGDRLLVLHDGIQETYPAKTGVYGIWKTGTGSAADIPQQVVDSLAGLGWHFDAVDSTHIVYTPEDLVDCALSWANYDDSTELLLGGLNGDKMYISSVQHLPIFKFESLQELKNFQSGVGAQLTLTQGYDEISSFSAVTAHMDEAYFEKYTLLAVYVPSSSCSYRYGINHVWVSGETLCIHVQRADAAADGDTAMAGWLLTAGLEKDVLAGITTFDADLNNLSD